MSVVCLYGAVHLEGFRLAVNFDVLSRATNADKPQKLQWDRFVIRERIMGKSKATKIPGADTICELPTRDVWESYNMIILNMMLNMWVSIIFTGMVQSSDRSAGRSSYLLNWSCGACGHVVRYASTNISEESTATVFRVKLQEGGSRHVGNFGKCLPKHTASHNRRPVN